MSISLTIALSPHGHLRLEQNRATQEGGEIAVADSVAAGLAKAFSASEAHGLLALAGPYLSASLSPSLRWWRELGRNCLTAQCQRPFPEGDLPPPVHPPPASELAMHALTAPPMTGIEYLDGDLLARLWHDTTAAMLAEMGRHPEGAEAWLRGWNPSWRLVGRVTFHLAENKRDPAHPFAFMATYTHRLSTDARPQYIPLGKALREYAGAGNREALLNLLSPVHAAAEQSDLAKELVETKAVFQPQSWSPAQAHRFLSAIPAFEQSGLVVRVPDWWKNRRTARPQVSVTLGEKSAGQVGLNGLLDFNLAVTLGGEPLSADDLAALRQAGSGLVFLKGQWVELDRDKLDAALAHWKEVEATTGRDGVSFIEGMRLLAGMPTAHDAAEAKQNSEHLWSHVEAGGWLRQILEKLRNPDSNGGPDFDPEAGLQATLRPYQRAGVHWLRFLDQLGLGACLADDMGLGKTIQVIALLNRLRIENSEAAATGNSPSAALAADAHRPSLLLAPASLLANWRSEIERFAPGLRLFFAHPSGASAEELSAAAENPIERFAPIDLVVTTYGMLARQEWLRALDWRLAILDEAQAIKNPSAKQTRAVKSIKARTRIALTGTPVENRISDLWSLFDFINPGLLGGATQFSKFIKNIDRDAPDAYGPVRQLVRPYILRRLKTDKTIIADLPDKTEMKTWCVLTRRQAGLYAEAVEELKRAVETTDGIQRRGLVLSFLMRFKQICNHPAQLTGDGDWEGAASGKFLRLGELCDEIASRQEKVLVFTQFREMTAPLAAHLETVFGRPGLVLHGGTAVKKRQEMVNSFQREEGPPFFILSLKAGGTGLNLTEAAHVVHFDRWWNPAVENQATDRAFRIGQKRNVLVHKFVCRGTIEERIARVIEQKSELADDLLSGGAEQLLTEMTNDDLINFVSLDLNTVGTK